MALSEPLRSATDCVSSQSFQDLPQKMHFFLSIMVMKKRNRTIEDRVLLSRKELPFSSTNEPKHIFIYTTTFKACEE